MAKVTGPLMSMDASGAFGGALVFGKWKGRNTVRQLVKPANPQTQDQQDARNRLRVTGVIQAWINANVTKRTGETETDKELIKEQTPAGYAWNGFLVDTIVGAGGIAYTAARAAYTALQAGDKTAWNTAAGALTPAILSAAQKDAGGVAGTPVTAGEVFFIAQYGLYLMGLRTIPGATPPTYA